MKIDIIKILRIFYKIFMSIYFIWLSYLLIKLSIVFWWFGLIIFLIIPYIIFLYLINNSLVRLKLEHYYNIDYNILRYMPLINFYSAYIYIYSYLRFLWLKKKYKKEKEIDNIDYIDPFDEEDWGEDWKDKIMNKDKKVYYTYIDKSNNYVYF